MSLDPLEGRWLAFGWDVQSVDGHDSEGISSTIAGLKPGKPHMLIAHTTFGKGVSFMESQIRWHYLPVNDEQYALAVREIGGAGIRKAFFRILVELAPQHPRITFLT